MEFGELAHDKLSLSHALALTQSLSSLFCFARSLSLSHCQSLPLFLSLYLLPLSLFNLFRHLSPSPPHLFFSSSFHLSPSLCLSVSHYGKLKITHALQLLIGKERDFCTDSAGTNVYFNEVVILNDEVKSLPSICINRSKIQSVSLIVSGKIAIKISISSKWKILVRG